MVCSHFVAADLFRLIYALVHNDFHQTHGLFPLFDDLEVESLGEPVEVGKTNGTGEANGAKSGGIENTPLTNGVAEHH